MAHRFIESWRRKSCGKTGKKRSHVIAVFAVVQALRTIFGAGFVGQQCPIDLRPEQNPTHRPEPDAVVLTAPLQAFRERDPGPESIRLVVEVSDTTLAFDRGPKALGYAQAGIGEYWILDVTERRVIVHREPRTGGYASILAYTSGESVAPLAAPEGSISVESLF